MRRCHVTVAGTCVELSVLLAESAALRRLPFLATGAVGVQLEREDCAAVLESWRQVEVSHHDEAAAAAGSGGCHIEVRGPKAQRRGSVMERDVRDGDPGTVMRPFVNSFGAVVKEKGTPMTGSGSFHTLGKGTPIRERSGLIYASLRFSPGTAPL
eukprot:Hpha_TRINITY_DN16583_c5_g2::TRINITY_DN16583_c5_g2_i2::g.134817::m.134817